MSSKGANMRAAAARECVRRHRIYSVCQLGCGGAASLGLRLIPPLARQALQAIFDQESSGLGCGPALHGRKCRQILSYLGR